MSSSENMPRRRQMLISLAIAIFISAHLVSHVTGDQHWPFVSYTLWSFRSKGTVKCLVPYGQPEDASKQEFRVWDPHTGIFFYFILYTMKKITQYPWRNASYSKFAAGCPSATLEAEHACASQRMLSQVLEYLYASYESTRASDPELPALRAMKIYEVEYETTPDWAFEVTSKILRAEWSVGGEGHHGD